MIEAVVMPNSPIEGLSMRGVRMHDRFGINLLALSRHGSPSTARLKNVQFKTGDILLMQGEKLAMEEALGKLGCLILGDRQLENSQAGSKALLSITIFAAAIIAASFFPDDSSDRLHNRGGRPDSDAYDLTFGCIWQH